jgi:hypothetical protein
MAKYMIEVVEENNAFWALVKGLFWLGVFCVVARACAGG